MSTSSCAAGGLVREDEPEARPRRRSRLQRGGPSTPAGSLGLPSESWARPSGLTRETTLRGIRVDDPDLPRNGNATWLRCLLGSNAPLRLPSSTSGRVRSSGISASASALSHSKKSPSPSPVFGPSDHVNPAVAPPGCRRRQSFPPGPDPLTGVAEDPCTARGPSSAGGAELSRAPRRSARGSAPGRLCSPTYPSSVFP